MTGHLYLAMSEAWTALALRFLRSGDWPRAAICAQVAEVLAEAAHPESAEEGPPDGPEPERLMQEVPAPPLRRTAQGRLRPRAARKLG